MDNCKILLFDKDKRLHKSFSGFANRNKLDLIIAETPVKAIKSIQKLKPDVAIIEHPHPKPNAFQICNFAHKNNVKSILHGHRLNKHAVLRAVRAGAADVIIKPAAEPIFLKKFRTILQTENNEKEAGHKKFEKIDFGKASSPAEKARIVLEKAKEIMALPSSVARIIQICNSEDSSVNDLVEPVTSDPAVTSMVFKRANSAASASSRRITTVKDAVVRIGMRETKNMAITLSVFKQFDMDQKSFGFNRSLYWIHALGAGIAARHIAQACGSKTPEDAFLVGLLHDLGKMILDDYINDEYKKVIKLAATESKRLTDVEKDVFEMNHAFVGARVGENWKLPNLVIKTIENHHKTSDMFTGGSVERLEQFLVMGNTLIKTMGLGHSGDFFIENIPPKSWKALFKGKETPDKLVQAIREELKEFIKMLGMTTQELNLEKKLDTNDNAAKVTVISTGQAALLDIFFQSRGFETSKAFWDDLKDVEEETILSVDIREDEESLVEQIRNKEILAGNKTIILASDFHTGLPDNIYIISPYQDIFMFEEVIENLME